MKTAKVIQANFLRDFQYNNKQFYVFDVQFDNNDRGEYTSTSQQQNKFTPGQTVDYTIESKTNAHGPYTKVKPASTYQGGGKGFSPEKEKRISRLSAVKSAMDYFTVSGVKPKNIQDAFLLADKIVEYCYNGSKPVQAAQPQAQQPANPSGMPVEDLPF